MPDRARASRAIRAAAPVRVGSVTLLPFERVEARSERVGPVIWVTARIEPYAVVVRDRDGVRAVGVGAEAVSLDELREAVPGLDALLEAP